MLHTTPRKGFLAFAAAAALTLGSLLTVATPTLAAGGQTGMITGTIVDSSSAPVMGADVTINGPSGSYKAHTDGKGKFNIIGADVDTYTITVQKDGFAKLSAPGVDVLGDQTNDLGNITLQKA